MQKAETKLANVDIYFEKISGLARGCKQQSGTTYGEEYSVLYKGSILTKEGTESTEFFLETEGGKELPLSFPIAAPIRDGHSVTALYASAGEAGTPMHPIGFYNHTTEKLHLAPLVVVYQRLGVGYPASQMFAKLGCMTVITTIALFIYLVIKQRASGYFPIFLLMFAGGLWFAGYGSRKLDANKNTSKYLAEYDQLKSEVTHLFAEAQPVREI